MPQTPIPSFQIVDQADSAYVFVSYAHVDSDWVYKEIAALNEAGINVWYDEGIGGGKDWSEVLAGAIQGAFAVLFYATPASITSENVANEISYALDKQIPVLVMQDKPVDLPAGMQLALGRKQAIVRSALSPGGFQRKALIAIHELLGDVGTVDVSDLIPGFNGRAAIAVLPFQDIGADDENQYFADGLVEELITALQRWNSFPVIARESTQRYGTGDVSLTRLGRELGVGYVLRGSVRRSGRRIRITASLADTQHEHQIWADRFDGELEDVFDLQDEITEKIIGAIEPEVLEQEKNRVKRVPVEDMQAWDLYLRGLAHMEADTWEDQVKALDYLQQARALDPGIVEVAAGLGATYVYMLYNHRTQLSEQDLAEYPALIRAMAEEAMRIDERSLWAYRAMISAHVIFGEMDQATNLADEVVARYAASAASWRVAAFANMRAGRFDVAVEQFAMLKRLSPKNPMLFEITNQEGGCLLQLGRLDDALVLLERSIALKRDHLWPHLFRTLALYQSNRPDEARDAYAQMSEEVSGFSPQLVREIDAGLAASLDQCMQDLGI